MTRSSLDLLKAPPREFRVKVCQEAERLLTGDYLEFSHADIATRLGSAFLNRGPGERRLRNCLDSLVNEGFLKKSGRGVFTKGSGFGSARRPVAGLMEGIDRAFHDAGGIMNMGDVLTAVNVHDDDGARLVRRCLSQSRRYCTELDIEGCNRLWLLRDVHRRAIPLAGRWIALDLRLAGNQFFSGGMDSECFRNALADCRARIARGLRDARSMANLDGNAFGESPAGIAFGDACRAASDVRVRGPFTHSSESLLSVAQLWESMVGHVGPEEAAVLLCEALERDNPQYHYVVQALDVRFWEALGEATLLDPVLLSRGAFMAAERPSQRGALAK